MTGNTSWGGHRVAFSKDARRRILERQPQCVCLGSCGRHGGRCQQPSTIADHIRPVAEGGTDDEEHNGQGMCVPCHDAKTRTEQARGRARKSRRRTPEPHPGLLPRRPE